jgi:hypothetical protein
MRSMYVMAFLTIGWSATAGAQSPNLFACRTTGGFSWGCALEQRAVAEPLAFEGERYQSEYRVVYDFPCTGHYVNLGFASESGLVPLQQSARNASATVIGSGPLRLFDPDPARTAGLTFQGDCRLSIQSVDVRPSPATQQQWSSEAQRQAQIINLQARLYLLVRDYRAMGSWNDEKLVLLRDRLHQLSAADPRNLQYKVLLETVVSALEHAPPPYSEAEIGNAASGVGNALRHDLDLAVEEGNRMVRRFDAWRMAVEATLRAALSSIPA